MTALETLRNIAARKEWVVLDTETTGLDETAEIVQIAIVDAAGQCLLDSLVRPTRRIPSGATAVHGITNEMVKQAPDWETITERVRQHVLQRDVIIYNVEFDTRLIRQTYQAHGLVYAKYGARSLTCAMKAYAEYFGEWDDSKNDYRYQRLTKALEQQRLTVAKAHSALGDCLMTAALVRRISDG